MKKLLFVICLAVMGCNESPEERSAQMVQSDLDVLSRRLEYYKDTRTNVCYSGAFIGYNFGVLTYVPCTPEIERIAHQFQSNPTVR